MKKIRETFRTNILLKIILIVFLIIVFWFKLFLPKPQEAIKPDTKIIFQVDSSKLQNGIDSSNRVTLINILQEREANSVNMIISSEGVKMESRLFYCAILAGLLSFLFASKETEKKKKRIVNILLTTIILLYFVDVHQQDMIKRNILSSSITSNAIHQLLKPQNNITYELSYDSIYVQYEKASEPISRWLRKTYNACSPDLAQIVYYIIPLVLILYNRKLLSRKE